MMIFCLAGAHTASLVVRVLRDEPAEGLCWWHEAQGWQLVQPSIPVEEIPKALPPARERPAWLARFDRYTGFRA